MTNRETKEVMKIVSSYKFPKETEQDIFKHLEMVNETSKNAKRDLLKQYPNFPKESLAAMDILVLTRNMCETVNGTFNNKTVKEVELTEAQKKWAYLAFGLTADGKTHA